MNVGELFVSLGVKGGEKTLATMTLAQDGMGKIRDMSFEAKAAIVAAGYALEKMLAGAGQHALGLESLSTVLGTSTKTLQEYEYAARIAGVSNGELAGTFMGLSKTAAEILRGESMPKGLNQIMATLHAAGDVLNWTGPGNSLENAAAHPEILFQALAHYAQLEKNVGLRDINLGSFGITDPTTIAAMIQGKFAPEIFSKANILSDAQLKANNQAREHLEAIKDRMGVGFERITSQFGPEFLNQIDKVLPKLQILAEAFARIVTKTDALSGLSIIFQGWADLFDVITPGIEAIERLVEEYQASDAKSIREDNRRAAETNKGTVLGNTAKGITHIIERALPTGAGTALEKLEEFLTKPVLQMSPGAVGATPAPRSAIPPQLSTPAPRMPATIPPQASAGAQVEVNQTLQFSHSGENSRQVAGDVRKAVRDAFRQLPSIGQVG